MKKTHLIPFLCVLVASSLSAETLLEEGFESFTNGYSLIEQSSNWKAGGAGEVNPQGSAMIQAPDGFAGNDTKYLTTTPGGGEVTTENVFVEFPVTGGNLTLQVDVLPRVGTGGILLTSLEGSDQHPVVIQFFGASNVLRAVSKKEDGSVELVEFGKFQLGRWYRVTVKLRFETAEAGGIYEISVIDLADGSVVGESAGLHSPTLVHNINGVILSATFGATSLYGWDNLRVETNP